MAKMKQTLWAHHPNQIDLVGKINSSVLALLRQVSVAVLLEYFAGFLGEILSQWKAQKKTLLIMFFI